MRQLSLKRVYRGTRTQEQPIFPGVYAETDPALYGLGDYLVANRHATWIKEPPKVATVVLEHPDIPTPPADEGDGDSLPPSTRKQARTPRGRYKKS